MTTRKDILDDPELHDEIRAMLLSETHHDHAIEMREGKLYWKREQAIGECVDALDLNYLVSLMMQLGHGKNSETLRRMYRGMGYSLFGYWELFHWDVNNPIANEYVPNKIP